MNTQKLKELFVEWQSAKVDSHYPTITFEESDTLEASFSALTDRLEAAERRVAELENDESRQRLANAEHQLYMKDLAINNIKASRKAQFEKRQAAERERDELRAQIARRDAAAGSPAAWAHRLINKHTSVEHPWVYGSAEKTPSEGDVFRVEVMPLYPAAPPAVVPPAISTEGLDPDSKDIDEVRNLAHIEGANWMRQQYLELGAQQQKVVELPDYDEPTKVGVTWDAGYNHGVSDCVKALDAAGVKLEVKK